MPDNSHGDAQPVTPLAVNNLRLRYPETGRVVLRGVNLRLQAGEIKLLIGPSGSGKSSLALTLNGLIPHQLGGDIRGQVLVEGRSTLEADVPWLATRVGMLFQDPDAQIATLSVADEVAFGMENLRTPPAQMQTRISMALRRVGLPNIEERSTDSLSGGQKQRLVIASTLAMGSSILVLDEPTANLDPRGTDQIFKLLSELKAEGISVLIIEHKLDDLIQRVDSMDILGWSGQIAAGGPPRHILRDERELLQSSGVWIPQVCELAYALAEHGIELAPFPITVDEAAKALEPLVAGKGAPVYLKPKEERASGPPFAVEAQGLSYSYPDGTPALSGASLHVAAGDFYALVGPNGSGKTTLARHLVGLLRSQHGVVRVAGDDVARLSPAQLRSRVGYVFQNPEHQFVALNVYDELAFSLRAQKLTEAQIRSKVEPLLAEFGLEEYKGANPYKLSQGQKRRLSVATMLALDPQVLILDEPTFGQDRASSLTIMNELCALNERGVTILMITHDMKLVAEYARTVGVMLGGTTAYEGSVRALFGDRNLLEAAGLDMPPLCKVSQLLREQHPEFPFLMTVAEFTEHLCALSGTSLQTASSTA